MSAESVVEVHNPSRYASGIMDWLQMLSGLLLVFFMWSHMILVSSVLIGPGVMNSIAHFFEGTYMAQAGGPLVFLAFLFHAVLAARKMPFKGAEAQEMKSHLEMFKHRDTRLWMVQVLTAMGILVMGAIHMWVVLTTLPISAGKSAIRIQGGFWLVFYLILLPLIEFHVGIGFYRIGVKWGVIKRRNRAWFKRLEVLMIIGFVGLGLASLARFWVLDPTPWLIK